MSKVLDEKLEKLNPQEKELWALRHTAEHVLHTAMQNLYPSIKKAMGPATDEGFYFDFDPSVSSGQASKISAADFPKIEKEMKKLIAADYSLVQEFIDPKEARKLFAQNPYKLEWIKQIEQRGEKLSIYKMIGGAKVVDLDICSGPHVSSTGKVAAFKLLSVAGAYWHGDEKNKMLTRIYGTTFFSQKELDEYLKMREEAEKRDHRKLGKELDLFLISEQVGGGLPIFTPKGNLIRREIENYLTQLKEQNGYQFVWTPHIANSQIYHTSQHWGKYDAMYTPMKIDKDEYVLKPMNCPHHFQVYLNKPRSYKELPLRIAENGTVYRHEKSGEVSGLVRVRSLTIDDTHTFIRIRQTSDELNNVLRLIKEVLGVFGFRDYKARLSLSNPADFSKYLGSKDEWEKAEAVLRNHAKRLFGKVEVGIGEAAFYGPKIDIMVKDSLGREWQLSTVQLDYNQPHNFNMTFIDEFGREDFPAVLHIAMVGSLERLIGILIEHFAGAFPVWLSPVQVAVIPVSDKSLDYARGVNQQLSNASLRAELNDRNETMQAKIRDAQNQKIPYMIIVGPKEESSGRISIRLRDGRDAGVADLPTFITRAKEIILTKSLDLW